MIIQVSSLLREGISRSVVEIKSQSDRIRPLVEKIEMFLSLGAEVGILIDLDTRTVVIYRNSGRPTRLTDNDTLTISELFPSWKLPVRELWPLYLNEE
ncbi:MAG: Uma2 family endonuclease [Spirulinaceae cyanobacterium]